MGVESPGLLRGWTKTRLEEGSYRKTTSAAGSEGEGYRPGQRLSLRATLVEGLLIADFDVSKGFLYRLRQRLQAFRAGRCATEGTAGKRGTGIAVVE